MANNRVKNNDVKTEEGYVKVSLVNQSVFIRKKKSCPLKDIDISEINYTNLNLINKFISERGRIAPSRITNVEVKKQRALAKAIKRARHLALISPIRKELEN
ncbi:MAG: 30S ribosomal protein S18 [Rickettsiales bacterium]|nr:30S ribosomal protein S18 [Rickettsiales bacterium]